MRVINKNTLLSLKSLSLVDLPSSFTLDKLICKCCKKSASKSETSLFATPLHIRCNAYFPFVNILTPLEERLVSPRNGFSQIRELGYEQSQLGLTRTIINVLASLDTEGIPKKSRQGNDNYSYVENKIGIQGCIHLWKCSTTYCHECIESSLYNAALQTRKCSCH